MSILQTAIFSLSTRTNANEWDSDLKSLQTGTHTQNKKKSWICFFLLLLFLLATAKTCMHNFLAAFNAPRSSTRTLKHINWILLIIELFYYCPTDTRPKHLSRSLSRSRSLHCANAHIEVYYQIDSRMANKIQSKHHAEKPVNPFPFSVRIPLSFCRFTFKHFEQKSAPAYIFKERIKIAWKPAQYKFQRYAFWWRSEPKRSVITYQAAIRTN